MAWRNKSGLRQLFGDLWELDYRGVLGPGEMVVSDRRVSQLRKRPDRRSPPLSPEPLDPPPEGIAHAAIRRHLGSLSRTEQLKCPRNHPHHPASMSQQTSTSNTSAPRCVSSRAASPLLRSARIKISPASPRRLSYRCRRS